MWLEIPKDSDFSLKNIPLGVCSLSSSSGSNTRRCVTAIGNKIIDLGILQDAGAFDGIDNIDENVFSQSTLNKYLSHDPDVWPKVRQRIIGLFDGTCDLLSSNLELQTACMYYPKDVVMELPCTIGDYTDFYSSREHATNVGTMFRGKVDALQPNWLHLPVGYHGRSSTIHVSGHPIIRPSGQLQLDPNNPKQGSIYGTCKLLDFELEVAFFVGGPPNLGPMTVEEAKKRIFGFCLMNDWSARDIQKWEYVPLGPFTAKNFATTISPWIVPAEALEPFKISTSAGTQHDPVPLPYLQDPDYSSFDIQLSVAIQSPNSEKSTVVSRSNFANLYWNAAQQLVHHSVTGCIMNPGDLLASGTISGPTESSFGSMLELSWKGTRKVDIGNGEVRSFLEDGDTVIMEGFCSRETQERVGFGQCVGTVLPAGTRRPPPNSSSQRYQDFKFYTNESSSSKSWHARISLASKNVSFETIPISVQDDITTSNEIPGLEFTDVHTGKVIRLTQSMAIIQFLDSAFPASKSLLSTDPIDKIDAMEMVEVVIKAKDTLDNDLEDDTKTKVVSKIRNGLRLVEDLIRKRKDEGFRCTGPYCMGTFSPTVVDVFLIPQLFYARLWGMNIDEEFPFLATIDNQCASHPWFIKAHPDAQADAES